MKPSTTSAVRRIASRAWPPTVTRASRRATAITSLRVTPLSDSSMLAPSEPGLYDFTMRNVALHSETAGARVPRSRDRPRSSDRVLQLLSAVAGSPTGVSLTEAATLVGLVPSTALRQLRSLEAADFLVRSDVDQLYRPGQQLIALAKTVFIGHTLSSTAQPFIDRLAGTTRESTYLAVADGPRRAT